MGGAFQAFSVGGPERTAPRLFGKRPRQFLVRRRWNPLYRSRRRARRLRLPRRPHRPREEDAENQRGHAKKASIRRKLRQFEQRPPGRQLLDHHAGEPLRQFADVGVGGAEQRILRRRVTDARQRRHVGDQRDAREADPEVVGEHHRAEHADVGTGVRERGEVGDRHALDDQAAIIVPLPEPDRAEAAGGDAEQRRHQADRRSDGRPHPSTDRVVIVHGFAIGPIMNSGTGRSRSSRA